MKKRNVIMIVVDCLRADRLLDKSRTTVTPSIDRLRRSSTAFTTCVSTTSSTNSSFASLLTSTYPFTHSVRALLGQPISSHCVTLAEVLAEAGYNTYAEVTGPLAPALGFDRGFSSYNLRDYENNIYGEWGEWLLAQLRERRFEPPFFLLLHLWSVHLPRIVVPPYDAKRFGATIYDRAVSSLDSRLGDLFSLLGDDDIIILTGDHGEYVSEDIWGELITRFKKPYKWLKKRSRLVTLLGRAVLSAVVRDTLSTGKNVDSQVRALVCHGFHVYEYLVRVPLIIRAPGILPQAATISSMVRHIDILPTLLELTGGRSAQHEPFRGEGLIAVVRRERDESPPAYLEASGGGVRADPSKWIGAIRTERYKYVRGLYSEQRIPQEFYDLQADPRERENLIERQEYQDSIQALATGLQQLLEDVDRLAVRMPASSRELSQQEEAEIEGRLKSLGYLD